METQEIILILLKQISEGDTFKYSEYNLGLEEFGRIVEMMQEDGLITGANVIKGGQGNKVHAVFIDSSRLTMKGLEYLNNRNIKVNSGALSGNITSSSDLSASVTVVKPKGTSNRQEISEWTSYMESMIDNKSTKDVLKKIGENLRNKFDAQWSKTRSSVHLYGKNKSNIVFAHLRIENEMIKCVGPNGLKGKNVKAHKSVQELIGEVNQSNVERFIYILNEALNNIEDIDNRIINQIKDDIKVTNINSDSVKGEDFLNISNEVKVISNLIALKNLDTPLSIGLFGNWGTGKSFFMKQVQKELEKISFKSKEITKKIPEDLTNIEKEFNGIFCEEIIHISFNAWHYVDANLWASLISHILNSILEELKGKGDSNFELELPSIKQLKKELEDKKQKLNEVYNKRDVMLKELRNNLALEEKEIKINISDIVKKIIKDGDVTNIVKEIYSEELSQAIENAIKSSDGFIEILKETKGFLNNIRNTWGVLDKKSKIYIIFIGIILLILSISFPIFLKNGLVKKLIVGLTWLVTVLTPIIGWFNSKTVTNARKKIKDWCNYLTELVNKQRIEKKKLEEDLVYKLRSIKNEIEVYEKDSATLLDQIQSLDTQIKDIDNNYIKYFVEQRINSCDYTRHLGIINLVRKDFEALSNFLKNTDSNSNQKIDRIVLYIDDLDRCPPKNVVEVLQAIHLILSFELFVVIVAVDVRWVSDCLYQKYETMFMEKNSIMRTTSYDYLEKIFQIPMRLKNVSPENSKRYINSLLNTNFYAIEERLIKEDSEEVRTEILKEAESLLDDDLLEMKLDIDIMQIDENDIKRIEEFIPILGNTPRTIKRFVNIYRLLKANNSQIVKDYHRETIFLLSIITGCPKISPKLLRHIMNDSVKDFESLTMDLEKSISVDDEEIELKRLAKFVTAISEVRFDIEKLKVLIPIVGKYSFYLEDLF